ncbi:DUF547 domain-containing protein [Erythrobacter sp. SD-21]|uniref:DUF547 domain-containing protein n=1 Tax=Erythrobacter sp. SD-21 TaxID=161528 RepID=UPI000A04BFC0|nr:DUF547 domain-containing protein [Erythrobacter sp. SD-21]
MLTRTLVYTAAVGLLSSTAPLQAQDGAQAPATSVVSASDFKKFVPAPSNDTTKIDYTFLDDALQYMVLRMGPSTRQGMTKPAPGLGTRRVYGHESRVRLEGNRVVFSYLDEEAIAPLTEYRQDLERLGSDLNIASLPKSEQLAFWINLHNVAVIEQIAVNYPIQSPSRMKLGAGKTPLDETPFITVGGVAMSPKDIRTKIVFPNWDDPDVIYGFFRGEVGGPSIQRRAYTGQNVSEVLGQSAKEFVNSLRGVEAFGDTLLVSAIYEEAAPFFFPDMGDDFRSHLNRNADEEVRDLVARKAAIKFNQYEETVADLAAGEREPSYSYIEQDGLAQRTRLSPSVARLLNERYEKYEKLRREGLLRGRVIVLPPTSSERAKEIEADAAAAAAED